MGPLKFLCCASAFGGVCFASACLRLPLAGNGASALRRFGATVASAMWSRQRALWRNDNGGFRHEASGLRETCGAAVPEAELPLVSNMWARGWRLGFCGLPGASRANFVLVRVAPPLLLRCVRGGFARHGWDTRPGPVPWRHATRALRKN